MSVCLRYSDSEEIRYFFPSGVTPETEVSKNSKFGDNRWYFYDESNPRLRNYKPSDLTITWLTAGGGLAYTPLQDAIVQVVKLFAFLYLHAPVAFGSRKAKTHPVTVCQGMKTLLPFLGHVQEKSMLDGGTLSPIQSLHDVTARHLRESLLDWDSGRGSDLRRLLIYMTNSIIHKSCEGFSPRWTPSDVRYLSFRQGSHRDDYQRVFPNPLFRLISNSATDDVVGFLRFIGERPSSAVTGTVHEPFSDLLSQGPKLVGAYVDLRLRQDSWHRFKDSGSYGDGMEAKRSAVERLGATPGQFLEYIRRVQEAACSLIALYTGARYSDLTGFKRGCLKKIRGMWFLVGTHIKQQDLDKPTDGDIWPAIPAIRDALRCLELFTEFTRNEYIISPLNTVEQGSGRPYSLNGLAQALERYIRSVDKDEAWLQVRVSPHRCRHTLAHQLARADLGLVFIAHQLKHLHGALNAVPPDVTLLYGGISDLKTERALQTPALHFEMAVSLYDPDSPIAGGGAEEFMERRKQYFEGMFATGLTKEEIITGLASKAVPFSSVGMGYCLGRREIKNKDGSTQKPPCMGSLQCSPKFCRNALITKNHAHLWRKVASQNRELAERPEMQHSREELLGKVNLANSILGKLGVAP